MRSALSDYKSFTKTIRQVLPYNFLLSVTGKLTIEKTNGQKLIVTLGEIERILQRDDLDVHRRRMYEAALEVFKKPPSASPRSPKFEKASNLGEEEVQ